MNKRFTIVLGVIMILIGGFSIAFNLFASWLSAWGLHLGVWRLWPLIIIGVGLLFALSPLLVRKRGLGGLFIPGIPILATGGILLFNSLFGAWQAWEWLWPLEVLAVAAGFLLASIYMRAIWLLFPAILIGANGLIFGFCVLSGRWDAWAVLWAVEPLAIGLSFLIINIKQRSAGLFIAGLILCAMAAFGLVGMTAVLPNWWLMNLVGPVVLMLVGVLLLGWGLIRRAPSTTVSDSLDTAEA